MTGDAVPEVLVVNDQVRLWVEQEASVHIKAVDQWGDPVELSPLQARQLAELLVALADKADGEG